jgi:hypothetical protein
LVDLCVFCDVGSCIHQSVSEPGMRRVLSSFGRMTTMSTPSVRAGRMVAVATGALTMTAVAWVCTISIIVNNVED